MTREVTKQQFDNWIDAHPQKLTKGEQPNNTPPMTYWKTDRGGIVALYTTDSSTAPPTIKYFVCSYG